MIATRSMRKIVSGLGFVEAPVWLDSGTLLASEVDTGWVLTIDAASGRWERLVHIPGGPSGLAVGPDGAFYATVSHGLRVMTNDAGYRVPAWDGGAPENVGPAGIVRIDCNGGLTHLYGAAEGNPLRAPNDLVFDSDGGFYFTDIGAVGAREADQGGLYYGRVDGSQIREVIHEPIASRPLTQPNGVALSPDGLSVYVAETATARVWEWAIESPGVLGAKADAHVASGARMLHAAGEYVLYDSMAVDGTGRVVVATLRQGALTVIGEHGATLVPVPEFDPYVTNLCFGEMAGTHTAFITCAGTGSIWACDWDGPIHRPYFADLVVDISSGW